MKDLLLLVHRIPYPPNKGDKIRSFNWLKHLGKEYRVHLGTFVDHPEDLEYVPAVQAMCAETYVARLHPMWAKLASLTGLASGKPLTLPYYYHRGLAAWVRARLATQSIDAVLVFSAAMAQYLPRDGATGIRTVCDFVDIDSDKWRQYSTGLAWPMSWLYRREAKRLLAYERAVAWRTDASVFVSDAEAELFRGYAPEVAERVVGVANGVDTDYFSPLVQVDDNPYTEHGPAIVFVGAMDYWPNVDAVKWFVDAILPRIRDSFPYAGLYIVGGRPTETVRKLQESPGVRVVGGVKDIRPYLAHAHVAVAPLRIARGIQNKVLEAMAMAKPTVVTPQALEGIHARPGEHLLIGTDAADFAARVVDVLRGERSEQIGAAARELVVHDYAWYEKLRRMQTLLEGDSLTLRRGRPDEYAGELFDKFVVPVAATGTRGSLK